MDGGVELSESFVAAAPDGCDVQVIALPDDPAANYDLLVQQIAPTLVEGKPVHLIAESFSGPLGILLAAAYPKHVQTLSLIATFAKSPIGRWAAWLPWILLFRWPIPALVAETFLINGHPDVLPVLRRSLANCSPATLQSRVQCVAQVDVSDSLPEIQCPVFYLRPEQDRLISRRCANHILQRLPTTHLITMPGPHLILQSQPAESWVRLCRAWEASGE